MYDEVTDTPPMARTSNLNEELGQVSTGADLVTKPHIREDAHKSCFPLCINVLHQDGVTFIQWVPDLRASS